MTKFTKKSPPPIDFFEEADTFSLKVVYSKDQHKLTITLKDFTNWSIYSKQFTK